MKRLKIVADAHAWGAERAFSELPGVRTELRLIEAPAISRETVRDADVLIVRSSTRVDRGLLENTRVRFVATATVGFDHLDTRWLEDQGIAWAHAAGSSTGSVLEYLTAALLELIAEGRVEPGRSRIGIIGVGRIGRRMSRLCRLLGISTIWYDPPREMRLPDPRLRDWRTLLEQADVLSLHVPLTRTGPHPTRHLLDARALEAFRGKGVINTARGACIRNRDLKGWLDADAGRWAVIDCWEHEPDFDPELAAHDQVVLATPHIAGHSLDGKARNTWYVHRALCRWLGVRPVWHPAATLPEPPRIPPVGAGTNPLENLRNAARKLYDIRRDDAEMRRWCTLPEASRAEAFREYRRHYPARRAWSCCPVPMPGADDATRKLARAIGICLV